MENVTEVNSYNQIFRMANRVSVRGDNATPQGGTDNNPLAYDRDVLQGVMSFVGCADYLSAANVSTLWRDAWGKRPKMTSTMWAVESCSRLNWARDCDLNVWDDPCSHAAATGRLDVLQYAISLGFFREGMPVCEEAARGGHLEVLKWCRANGYPWGLSGLRAAGGGHLEVLRWCATNGCPMDIKERKFPRPRSRGLMLVGGQYQWSQGFRAMEIVSAAAQGGHLEVLRWCRSQGYAWPVGTSYLAATRGHFDVLRWLRANGCPWSPSTMAGAVEANNLEMLQWCRVNGCPWTKVHRTAAQLGNLEVLKWCHANYPRDQAHDSPCAPAVAHGHLDVVRWMRANGCSWGRSVCHKAASGGHFEMLKWCRANGRPWETTRPFWRRSFKGSVEMMVWATENGCPWMSNPSDFQTICEQSAAGGNVELLKWCQTHGALPSTRVSLSAARNRRIHVLEWLRAEGNTSDVWADGSLCEAAASSGSLDTIKWCRDNGCPWDERAGRAARESGNGRLWQWCKATNCPGGQGS